MWKKRGQIQKIKTHGKDDKYLESKQLNKLKCYLDQSDKPVPEKLKIGFKSKMKHKTESKEDKKNRN